MKPSRPKSQTIDEQTKPKDLPADPNDELVWLAQHPEEVARHAGKWIAVHGRRIIAAGDKLQEVLSLAEAQGVSQPLLHRVRERDIADWIF